QLLMAECYLGFGMQQQAEALYLQIASAPHDSHVVARARIQLAQFEYQRGYYDKAFTRLAAMKDKVPPPVMAEWQLAMTNTLLAQDRYNEAAAMLAPDGNADDDLAPVLRYNLAVALMHAGSDAEGGRQLNQVGTMDVTNLEQI